MAEVQIFYTISFTSIFGKVGSTQDHMAGAQISYQLQHFNFTEGGKWEQL